MTPHKSMPQKINHDFKEYSDASTTMIDFAYLQNFKYSSLRSLPNQCPKRLIMILRNNIFISSCGYICIHIDDDKWLHSSCQRSKVFTLKNTKKNFKVISDRRRGKETN